MRDIAEGGSTTEIVYSLSRATWLTGWWAWAAAVLVVGGLLYAVYRLARRDVVELAAPTRVLLIMLRLGLVVGLVFFVLGLERRARQRITRPSEVAVLIDTSQSMALPQGDEAGSESRIEAVQRLVAETPLLGEMAGGHRVTVYTISGTGELDEVIVSSATAEDRSADALRPAVGLETREGSPWAILGCVLLGTGALAMLIASALQVFGRQGAASPLLLASAVLAIAGGGLLAATWTVHTGSTLAELVGVERIGSEPGERNEDPDGSQERDAAGEPGFDERLEQVNWASVLATTAAESRIGDAIRATVTRHDPATLAGILLLSDGQSNAGTPPVAAAGLLARGGTAIYPIGFGSARPPTNVRIVELDAPRRVYPGDRFTAGVVLQGSGQRNMTVQVQLLDAADPVASGSAPATALDAGGADAGTGNAVDAANMASGSGEAIPAGAEVVDSQEVEIPADGTLVGVRFDIEPEAVGRRTLAVRVVPPPGDQNQADDVRQARYEVVSRRLRVLLVAGGPMREYRFVRNLLHRDESVELDVWLQSAVGAISQDASRVLDGFPSDPEQLFEYDAILAFDPDWMQLDAAQLELLDQWLSRQAGGLVLISGPVYMPQWMRQRTDPRVGMVRNFFPVALSTRGPLLSAGRTGGDTPWPLEFTADAARADFLALDNDPRVTADLWETFSGVYDYVGVNEAKPGARVYARFSDPSTAISDALPIYLASQFYGAGRVFFQGSGEMWRLRGLNDSYFDAYYTKLVRWVSEGRLLRDSNRGVLMVDRPRAMVGDTITVRAILTDAQFQPLRVPRVEAQLLTPSGRIEPVRLTPLEGEPREGTYSGRFLVREPGGFQLRLALGDALREEVLRQSVQVGLPTLELERPRRNDEVLRSLAASTGGQYLPMDGVSASDGAAPNNRTSSSESSYIDPMTLVSVIQPQPQPTILPGTPDRDFERRRNASLMWLLCSMLTMEWVVRRLHRMA